MKTNKVKGVSFDDLEAVLNEHHLSYKVSIKPSLKSGHFKYSLIQLTGKKEDDLAKVIKPDKISVYNFKGTNLYYHAWHEVVDEMSADLASLLEKGKIRTDGHHLIELTVIRSADWFYPSSQPKGRYTGGI